MTQNFPFVRSFLAPDYLLWRHKVADMLAKTRGCHDFMDEHPEWATRFYPIIRAAQEAFTRYMEEVLAGRHDASVPPEFLNYAHEMYEKSRVDWTKRGEYSAFEGWLAEKFP